MGWNLFIYGTLKTGEPNHWLIKKLRNHARFLSVARTKGNICGNFYQNLLCKSIFAMVIFMANHLDFLNVTLFFTRKTSTCN